MTAGSPGWISSTARPVLGLDVGGVLVDRVAENSDTSFFGRRPMDTPMVAGARQAISQLAPLFGGRVYVVSKAGPRTAERTRRWLAHQELLAPGLIPPEHLHFVPERAAKAAICRDLGVTHFVDDRPDVLGYLTTVPYRYLFEGGRGRVPPADHLAGSLIRVATWPDAVARIRRSAPLRRRR